MLKIVAIISSLCISGAVQAQHKIGIAGGYTLSKVRALYPANHQPSFIDKDFTTFSFCHAAYVGVFYEYSHKKLRLQTGLSSLTIGAGNTPWPDPDATYPWYSYYLTTPLLVGYAIPLSKTVRLVPQGGVELGLQWGNPFIAVYGQKKYWGHVGILLGAELNYKRFSVGVRGMWGLTDFLVLPPYRYRHTALTTYLSYTLWDHAKAKQRRLEREQAKRLGE